MPRPWTYESSWGTAAPASALGSGSGLIYGNIFKFAVAGRIVGMRFYRTANDNGEHVGGVNLEANNALTDVVYFKYNTGATPVGWQHAYFGKFIYVVPGTLYNVLVEFSDRRAAYTSGALNSVDITTGNIVVPKDTSTHWNGTHGVNWGRLGWTHEPGVRFGVDVLFLREGATT